MNQNQILIFYLQYQIFKLQTSWCIQKKIATRRD